LGQSLAAFHGGDPGRRWGDPTQELIALFLQWQRHPGG